MKDPLNAAVIGCGLIGQRRAQTMAGARLVACADLDAARSAKLAAAYPGAVAYENWRALLESSNCDIVVVATLHDSLAEITSAAIAEGCHVLVEKPAARRSVELDSVMEATKNADVRVRVGFNHRYHRALQKARGIVDEGALGELMYITAQYGHGGRIGYDREWRANPKRSGGGELIDQGPHLIDLSRWFLGDLTVAGSLAATYYWDMPVDDNAFMLLRNCEGKAAFLHASCSEWKNKFSFAIHGQNGKLEITGLGGSYGIERLAHYNMLPEMGPPETTIFEYPMTDNSWAVEFSTFVEDIRTGRESVPGLKDAQAALRIVETIYEASGYDHST